MDYQSIFQEKWRPIVPQPNPQAAAHAQAAAAASQAASQATAQATAQLHAQLAAKEAELVEARTRIDVLVAAMYQARVPVPGLGELDAEQVAHRITCLIRKLREENAQLAHKATDAYTSQLEVDLAILRR